MSKTTEKPRSRTDIIERLKLAGPSDAASLAKAMGITAMAVRQHLYDLQAEQIVEAHDEPRPVGRPAKLWSLTAAADKYFPDAHADLAVGLIGALRRSLGEQALQTLIAERSRQQTEDYRRTLDAQPTLQDKLTALSEIRSREGYMAHLEETDSGYLFIENHCPICSAAKACSGLCAMELEVFSDALGPDYKVERTDHILSGARRCAYHVEKV